MEFLQYIRQKGLVTIIRYLSSPGPTATPDERISIPSRDAERIITVHIYRSKSSKPTPVLVNFHGSGFVLPLHGSDDFFARYISTETDYTVIDCAYRLAPENPHPAAINDVEDIIKWVVSQPTEFDISKISISGFSAGANLALVTSSVVFKQGTFHSVIAFYPPTDLATDPATKVAPDTSGKPIPSWMANFFDDAYMPAGLDRKDPTVSPFYAAGEWFPDRMLFITCARDNLCHEAEALAQKIKAVPGKDVVCMRMDGCDHGWDKHCKPDSREEEARDKAYSLAKQILQGGIN
ncbi:hypothetical protein N7495_005918 [Penicillium taxi]|uniref:uncharacterized protein n=1 Tax=Penicillium taxi TaxID=168475 RepID=UPI0025457408|nr:uncharacterized protein N7495_005918 [Penicillium taxi]KAJ5894227.1 hypothetical protein N7495_005918 [Penicillium taxi]